MKFHQLPIGARFRYKGTEFRKVSPLKAASEGDDAPRLVARSAEVTRLDDQGESLPGRLPDTISGVAVAAALDRFLATCARATTRIEPPLEDRQRTQLAQAFNAAADDLLMQLAVAD
jgi:hypothetical protein